MFLATSRRGELLSAPALNAALGLVVNATRSTPFIILVVAIIPFTRLVAGTSLGTGAAAVPLTVAAAPYIARLVEAAIREVDHGLVEAARAFGASPAQIIRKVLIPEALPGIVLGLTWLSSRSSAIPRWRARSGAAASGISGSATATSVSGPR